MVLIFVLCPHCHSDQVIKGGKTKAGQQRYKCQKVSQGIDLVLDRYPKLSRVAR